jgi:hypothetical protein
MVFDTSGLDRLEGAGSHAENDLGAIDGYTLASSTSWAAGMCGIRSAGPRPGFRRRSSGWLVRPLESGARSFIVRPVYVFLLQETSLASSSPW